MAVPQNIGANRCRSACLLLRVHRDIMRNQNGDGFVFFHAAIAAVMPSAHTDLTGSPLSILMFIWQWYTSVFVQIAIVFRPSSDAPISRNRRSSETESNTFNAPIDPGTDGASIARIWQDDLLPNIAAMSPELAIISADSMPIRRPVRD